MTENMSSFEKWRNDKLMFLDGKATDFLSGLVMMNSENLLSDEDYRKINDCQLQAYDMAVEMNFESEKINFLDGLKRAPYPEDFYLKSLQDAKKLMETDKESQNVIGGLKQFTTIKGSQYQKIISDYEQFKNGKLQQAYNYINGNQFLTAHYKYLKWLELQQEQAKKPTKKRPEPVTYQWTKQPDIQLPELYRRLVDGGFIAPETSSETFTACFTSQPVQNIPNKIKWLKSKALLAYFIDCLIYKKIQDTNWWQVASYCFDKGSGLINTRNQFHNNNIGFPKGYHFIDEVLSDL